MPRHDHRYPLLAIFAGVAILAGLIFGSRWIGQAPAWSPGTLQPTIASADHVRVLDPVTVSFQDNLDLSSLKLAVDPAVDFKLTPGARAIQLAPSRPWAPSTKYTIRIAEAWNVRHTLRLRSWSGTFATQARVSVAGFQSAGRSVGDRATVRVRAPIAVLFTLPMDQAATRVLFNDKPVDVAWSQDGKAATFTPDAQPYQPFGVRVADGARAASGDPLTDGGSVTLSPIPIEPSNYSTGGNADVPPPPPIEVVIENSGAAKPQSGMQDADMVFEYVSEYGISRWTAMYFNRVSGAIGPVRSCRMINPYLDFAFSGIEACSGASAGTLHYVFGVNGPAAAPGQLNDFDHGNHFFRSSGRPAPHNVYTTSDRMERMRSEWPGIGPRAYVVDSPHPDVVMGQPAPAPVIPLHGAGYTYDQGRAEFMRIDQGAPLVDANLNRQVGAKNVVVVHTRWHDAGWIEDENGGAHSVWYDLLGAGPAEIYTLGRVVHGTWHMGDPGQPYWNNNQPMWFTDEGGHVMELNTGLTWVHVVGDGQ